MNPQAARPAQPIWDVSAPTQFASVPVQAAPGPPQVVQNNPIAGGALPLPAMPQPAAQKTDDLDKVLTDINKDVKRSLQKPNPLTKPTFVIAAAIIVGLTLMIAAFFAFKKPS